MSQIDLNSGGAQFKDFEEEKSISENDENNETEDLSENNALEIASKRKSTKINFRKKTKKSLPGRLTISLRTRKCVRQTKTKKQNQNSEKEKVKKYPIKKKISEKRVDTPKYGKRCHMGGKAKVKPPAAQENQDKNESDDDSDNTYFNRISLGHFQQLKDKSGASTSYQSEEKSHFDAFLYQNQARYENSEEEEELRELQMWGRNVLNTYFYTVNNAGNYRKLLGHVNK